MSEAEIRKLGADYHRKDDDVELECKACHNWNHEASWVRKHYRNSDYLICPNCDVWNKGTIDSRPIKRSKTVSVRDFFKGVPGRGVDY